MPQHGTNLCIAAITKLCLLGGKHTTKTRHSKTNKPRATKCMCNPQTLNTPNTTGTDRAAPTTMVPTRHTCVVHSWALTMSSSRVTETHHPVIAQRQNIKKRQNTQTTQLASSTDSNTRLIACTDTPVILHDTRRSTPIQHPSVAHILHWLIFHQPLHTGIHTSTHEPH